MDKCRSRTLAALVPLRSGSKGIPNKNIIDLGGKPLFAWVLHSLSAANVKTYVSTDCCKIAKLVYSWFPAACIIMRPIELSDDTASTEAVIDHWIASVIYDDCMLVQATSPFLKAKDIKNALKSYHSNDRRSLVSVTRKHEFIWADNGEHANYEPKSRPRRQEWTGQLVENGAMYIFPREGYLNNHSRCWFPSNLYEMDSNCSIEIDEYSDLLAARGMATWHNKHYC